MMLLAVVGLIWYGFYSSKKERIMLESCSQKSVAVVVNIYKPRKKGYTIKYNYIVNGEKYSSSESIRRSQKDSFFVGDTILINYSCEDFNVSSIN